MRERLEIRERKREERREIWERWERPREKGRREKGRVED